VRFLISGYYGFDNLGDEALLTIIVAMLRQQYAYAEIEVLSATPDETRHALRVDATPRGDVRAVLRAVDRADVVLSGGGGLLQNSTSLRSLMYYSGVIRRAITAGKRTMIFAQSIGPLDFVGRRVVRQACRGLAAATVRDERSREVLAPLVPGVTVQRTADPVFLIERPPDDARLEPHGLGAQSDPLVLVSVRRWPNSDHALTRVAEAVDRLAARGARVGFVPFAGASDAEASTIVMRKCRSHPTLLPVDDLETVAARFARARFVIGMRLHSLILAVRFGVPFLAVSYDPKVRALCDDIGYPLAPLWSAGDKRDTVAAPDLADELWGRRDELAGIVTAAAQRMRALALDNFRALDRVVSAEKRPQGDRDEGSASR
jgi:polysaccharide pyruvyl transferase CsaB